jgi:hypothetical protein
MQYGLFLVECNIDIENFVFSIFETPVAHCNTFCLFVINIILP